MNLGEKWDRYQGESEDGKQDEVVGVHEPEKLKLISDSICSY